VEKIRKSSSNVFIDFGFPPHEAAVMLLRAQLAEALRNWMEENQLTQAQAARSWTSRSLGSPKSLAVRWNCFR